MSKNQARKLRSMMIPVKNHPQGRAMCSMYKALLIEKDGKGVIHEGVLHWFNYSAPQDRENEHHDPRKGVLRYRESIEPADKSEYGTGMITVQLEQGI